MTCTSGHNQPSGCSSAAALMVHYIYNMAALTQCTYRLRHPAPKHLLPRSHAMAASTLHPYICSHAANQDVVQAMQANPPAHNAPDAPVTLCS